MAEQRRLFRSSHSVVVAVPSVVRQHLAVDRGQAVHWHVSSPGEVVLTKLPLRSGRPADPSELERELKAARLEVRRLRQRYHARERALYAEGYALGRQDSMELLLPFQGMRATGLLLRAVEQRARGARATAASGRDNDIARVSADPSEPLTAEQALQVTCLTAMM